MQKCSADVSITNITFAQYQFTTFKEIAHITDLSLKLRLTNTIIVSLLFSEYELMPYGRECPPGRDLKPNECHQLRKIPSWKIGKIGKYRGFLPKCFLWRGEHIYYNRRDGRVPPTKSKYRHKAICKKKRIPTTTTRPWGQTFNMTVRGSYACIYGGKINGDNQSSSEYRAICLWKMNTGQADICKFSQ